MGFCLFNNVAIAAREALSLGLSRIMIVDWDVHHGNGTQDAFYHDGQVGFLSIHRSPFYPGTGEVDETGAGEGLGTNLNIPVPFGITQTQFFDQFRAGVEKLANRIRPELILISAGFDAHRLDPVGGLCLEAADFAVLTKIVLDVATIHASGRVVSLLEGGYHLDMMPQSVVKHLEKLVT
jgi:acetoin utilization deacetylase AcuC-like enzyme